MFDMIRFGLQVMRLRILRRCHYKEIVALQERRWRNLVRYASSRSPFYRERFRSVDLSRCQPPDLHPLTKAEMMAHFNALVTDRRIRRAEVERFIAEPANLGAVTSTGTRFATPPGARDSLLWSCRRRETSFLGLRRSSPGDTNYQASWGSFSAGSGKPVRLAVVTQKPGFYPSGAVFSYLAAASMPLLKLLHLSVFDPVADLVARLNEFQPEFIAAYPGAWRRSPASSGRGACLHRGDDCANS